MLFVYLSINFYVLFLKLLKHFQHIVFKCALQVKLIWFDVLYYFLELSFVLLFPDYSAFVIYLVCLLL